MTWRKIVCWIRGHKWLPKTKYTAETKDGQVKSVKECGYCHVVEIRWMEDIVLKPEGRISGEVIETIKSPPPYESKLSRIPSGDVERKKEEIRIAEANRNRRQKFAHAEHFKRRQPTTARKLWNPQAQPKKECDEDDRNEPDEEGESLLTEEKENDED